MDATPIHPAGLPLRMTVIRLADGGPLLHPQTQQPPRRVIMTHGTPFEEGATGKLRASLASLLRGRTVQRAIIGAATGGAALLSVVGWAAARRRGR